MENTTNKHVSGDLINTASEGFYNAPISVTDSSYRCLSDESASVSNTLMDKIEYMNNDDILDNIKNLIKTVDTGIQLVSNMNAKPTVEIECIEPMPKDVINMLVRNQSIVEENLGRYQDYILDQLDSQYKVDLLDIGDTIDGLSSVVNCLNEYLRFIDRFLSSEYKGTLINCPKHIIKCVSSTLTYRTPEEIVKSLDKEDRMQLFTHELYMLSSIVVSTLKEILGYMLDNPHLLKNIPNTGINFMVISKIIHISQSCSIKLDEYIAG